MKINLKTCLEQTRKFLGIIISPKISAPDILSPIELPPVRFMRPTVDGSTYLRLEQLCWVMNNWTSCLLLTADLEKVKSAINSFVVCEYSDEPAFDFSRIQSMCSSSSFGSLDSAPSCLDDALIWGRSLYAGKNLDFRTDTDFEKNTTHVTVCGFGIQALAHVNIYNWHADRVVWSNNDGSHHGSAVIRQIHDQGRVFNCNATVKRYTLNPDSLVALKDEYYLLIAHEEYAPSQCLTVTFRDMGLAFGALTLPYPYNAMRLYAIPKSQYAVFSNDLRAWVVKKIESQEMMDLYMLANEPSTTIEKYSVECKLTLHRTVNLKPSLVR